MKEEAVQFGPSETLVGIVTTPADDRCRSGSPAVIFLNSGLIHRVGPNRLHVTIARELAEQSITSFRIDLGGIGDSSAGGGTLAVVDRWVGEAKEAMDYLSSSAGIRQFVLAGNCSGAGVALLAAFRDPRVVGTVLINLQGPKTYLRYYLRLALAGPQLWRRLISGTARFRTILTALQGFTTSGGHKEDEVQSAEPVDVDAGLAELGRRGTQVLVVYCSWDQALDYYQLVLKPKLEKYLSPEYLRTEVIAGMNHDFSLLVGQKALREIINGWITQRERWDALG